MTPLACGCDEQIWNDRSTHFCRFTSRPYSQLPAFPQNGQVQVVIFIAIKTSPVQPSPPRDSGPFSTVLTTPHQPYSKLPPPSSSNKNAVPPTKLQHHIQQLDLQHQHTLLPPLRHPQHQHRHPSHDSHFTTPFL
jgi:hypothetical protein